MPNSNLSGELIKNLMQLINLRKYLCRKEYFVVAKCLVALLTGMVLSVKVRRFLAHNYSGNHTSDLDAVILLTLESFKC